MLRSIMHCLPALGLSGAPSCGTGRRNPQLFTFAQRTIFMQLSWPDTDSPKNTAGLRPPAAASRWGETGFSLALSYVRPVLFYGPRGPRGLRGVSFKVDLVLLVFRAGNYPFQIPLGENYPCSKHRALFQPRFLLKCRDHNILEGREGGEDKVI